MVTEDISRAVLSSLFYAVELSDNPEHELMSVEVSIDDFQHGFHKIMVHLFNYLKDKGEPVTFDVAVFHLTQQRVFDQNEFLNIMATTPFGTKRIVESYLSLIRTDNKKSLIGRI